MTKLGKEQRSGQHFLTNREVADLLEEAGASKIENLNTGHSGVFIFYAPPCTLDHEQFDHKDYDYEETQTSAGGFVTSRYKKCPECGEKVEVDEIAGM